jgi:histidinol-phosphate phosphatase family protein
VRPARPAVFLDRDGTIIEDRHHIADPDQVTVLPGAADAIVRLNRAGWPVVLVSNQSGIGLGIISEPEFNAVHGRFEALLLQAGARLTAAYYCPHAPEAGCGCRKPRALLFERAAGDHHLDLATSFYIGDRWRDVEAGVRAGGFGILLDPPLTEVPTDRERIRLVPSLAAAVDLILGAG